MRRPTSTAPERHVSLASTASTATPAPTPAPPQDLPVHEYDPFESIDLESGDLDTTAASDPALSTSDEPAADEAPATRPRADHVVNVEPPTPATPPRAVLPALAASMAPATPMERRTRTPMAHSRSDARPAPRPPIAPEAPRSPADGDEGALERTATAPQLRRFIKSRAYVPMHELRRRFAINGGDDEVTPVDLEPRKRVFVGLPEREGRLLGELLRAGDIGYELSLDPISPIVVGVYPMRPVTRV